MTKGLEIVRSWRREDGTDSRLAEMINAEIGRLRKYLEQIEKAAGDGESVVILCHRALDTCIPPAPGEENRHDD